MRRTMPAAVCAWLKRTSKRLRGAAGTGLAAPCRRLRGASRMATSSSTLQRMQSSATTSICDQSSVRAAPPLLLAAGGWTLTALFLLLPEARALLDACERPKASSSEASEHAAESSSLAPRGQDAGGALQMARRRPSLSAVRPVSASGRETMENCFARMLSRREASNFLFRSKPLASKPLAAARSDLSAWHSNSWAVRWVAWQAGEQYQAQPHSAQRQSACLSPATAIEREQKAALAQRREPADEPKEGSRRRILRSLGPSASAFSDSAGCGQYFPRTAKGSMFWLETSRARWRCGSS
mmetsp:Transcript_77273/g.249999  ORF Transcript_77273/g.249999 Transcript_77273/m.249999 type:complete len:298 (+) Transcript_77273:406-1299(+)